MQESIPQAGSPCIRRRIVQAAIQLHRQIGFKKTTVAPMSLAERRSSPLTLTGSSPQCRRSERPLRRIVRSGLRGISQSVADQGGYRRPAFDEMMDLGAGAVHHVPCGQQSIDLTADLRGKTAAQR
jgi:hypothetical protein